MRNTAHLPLFGVGPLYGAIVVALTVAGCVAGSLIAFGNVPPLLILGVVCFVDHTLSFVWLFSRIPS
jgi:hypothetical protein